eukprot:symbB.v1.2.005187.t1/scaffold298.1/size236510/31
MGHVGETTSPDGVGDKADPTVRTCSQPVLTPKQLLIRCACLFFNVLSGLVNGYDICITTGILDFMDRDLVLCQDEREVSTCFLKEAVLSSVGLGALLSRVSCTGIADRFGRRAAIFAADMLIVTSIGLQSSTRSVGLFFLSRFLVGMGMGLAFVVTPTYLCEIAPQRRRGLFICLNEVAVCIGCLLGLHISSRSDTSSEWQWQNVVAIAAFPAAIQLVFVFTLPESPRWHALRGDIEALDRSVELLGLHSETAELKHLAENKDWDAQTSSQPMCESVCSSCRRRVEAWKEFKRPFLISLGLAAFTASIGSLAVQAYAYDLLKVCQVEDPASILPSIGWMKLAGAFVAMFASDSEKVGRRRLVITGSLLCTLCDAILAVHLAFPGLFPAHAAALCIVLRIFAWTAGYGGVQFLLISEILPSSVRSSFTGQCQAVASIIDILIFQVFESLLFSNTVATFVIFGSINLSSCLFAARFLPDLRGVALEANVGPGAKRAYNALEEDRRADPEPTIAGPLSRRGRLPALSISQPRDADYYDMSTPRLEGRLGLR